VSTWEGAEKVEEGREDRMRVIGEGRQGKMRALLDTKKKSLAKSQVKKVKVKP